LGLLVRQSGIAGPALIVIGAVVSLADRAQTPERLEAAVA
jgi:siroheme synthase